MSIIRNTWDVSILQVGYQNLGARQNYKNEISSRHRTPGREVPDSHTAPMTLQTI